MSKDTIFYFGPVPDEYLLDHIKFCPKDWEPDWYFRIRVDHVDEEIKIEDSCGRMVPFCFSNIKSLRRTLKLIKELV